MVCVSCPVDNCAAGNAAGETAVHSLHAFMTPSQSAWPALDDPMSSVVRLGQASACADAPCTKLTAAAATSRQAYMHFFLAVAFMSSSGWRRSRWNGYSCCGTGRTRAQVRAPVCLRSNGRRTKEVVTSQVLLKVSWRAALCNANAFAIRLREGCTARNASATVSVVKCQRSSTGQEYMPVLKITTPD